MPKKQESLPGMEDREITELEESAHAYAAVRDERMYLTAEEVELKVKLLALMKKYEKEKYVHAGVEISVVHEQETVKVRIRPAEIESVAPAGISSAEKAGERVRAAAEADVADAKKASRRRKSK